MELDAKALEMLRLRALYTIDGLWFLEVEKEFGFEKALEVDLEVWKKYGVIMIRRIAKEAGIEIGNENKCSAREIMFLVKTISDIDGSECDAEIIDENSFSVNIKRCTWWDALCRSGREEIVPCEHIDEVIFEHWLSQTDSRYSFEITRSKQRGDDDCSFIIKANS